MHCSAFWNLQSNLCGIGRSKTQLSRVGRTPVFNMNIFLIGLRIATIDRYAPAHQSSATISTLSSAGISIARCTYPLQASSRQKSPPPPLLSAFPFDRLPARSDICPIEANPNTFPTVSTPMNSTRRLPRQTEDGLIGYRENLAGKAIEPGQC
jgi:hypothetical protein